MRLTLKMRIYARALYQDTGATLDDAREAVTTLEETERIARRVLGGAHPTVTIERDLKCHERDSQGGGGAPRREARRDDSPRGRSRQQRCGFPHTSGRRAAACPARRARPRERRSKVVPQYLHRLILRIIRALLPLRLQNSLLPLVGVLDIFKTFADLPLDGPVGGKQDLLVRERSDLSGSSLRFMFIMSPYSRVSSFR